MDLVEVLDEMELEARKGNMANIVAESSVIKGNKYVVIEDSH